MGGGMGSAALGHVGRADQQQCVQQRPHFHLHGPPATRTRGTRAGPPWVCVALSPALLLGQEVAVSQSGFMLLGGGGSVLAFGF